MHLALFTFQNTVTTVLNFVVLVATLWAFVDALARRTEVYPAAGKLTKPAWTLILGISLGVQLLMGALSLLGFGAIVAMLVYFLDVRPALAALTRRR